MLVLSRKLGEKIFIGNNVVITVVDIDHHKVRIGVSAPKDVGVWREELYNAPPPSPRNEGTGTQGSPA